MAIFSQFSKCLYCIWPAIVIGIAWWLSRMVEDKTYYLHLTPGVDPLSPQGDAEFETRRLQDAEKRHIIYWAAGIIAIGYLASLGFNTFTLREAAAQPTATPTRPPSPTPTQVVATPIFTPTLPTLTISPTQGTETPTYVPTATDRIVYLAGSQSTVIVTVLVSEQIQIIVTATFIPSPTPTRTATLTRTPSSTWTPIPSQTASPTSTPSSTWTATPTVTDTPTSTPTEGETP
jgi:hypothetical protein